MTEYTREQLWKLYKKLPEELKDAIFSEDTANSIGEICERNGIEEKTSEVARYTGRVLLGILPPDEFQTALEKEVGLVKDKAKKVAREINRFVFYPVKESLVSLYRTEIPPARTPSVPPPEIKPPSLKEEGLSIPKEKPEEKRVDIYREPIE
ncbi:hypothetical protein J7K44_01155 [bacterium]|nr:hypothetical protein [bacterium]